MLYSYHSNRLDRLLDPLSDLIAEPTESPFEPAWVIVPTALVADWLTLSLARRLGICANIRFQLPAAAIWSLLRETIPAIPETSEFDLDRLWWHIATLLSAPAIGKVDAALADYLKDGDDRKRLDLARSLAAAFDRYLVYRPDWIGVWERGEATHWQAQLWRTLSSGNQGMHWLHAREIFQQQSARGLDIPNSLPRRLIVFGVAGFSPGYWDLLARFAGHIDVHLFYVNPCREYWGDIVSERLLSRRAAHGDRNAYATAGNPLLAAWGQQARDFIDVLQETPSMDAEQYAAPKRRHLLGHLQADIFELTDRTKQEAGSATVIAADDRSLQLHICHSPLREVEVLHTNLTALFERLPVLCTEEIAVMVPALDDYAAYVEAVFESAEPHIPYCILGHAQAHAGLTARAMFALLELADSRYESERVLAVLEHTPVQRRFDIEPAELARLKQWVVDSGIRWGIDAEHRSAFGLPAVAEHTWRMGLDRLVLGYAMPADEPALIGNVLPYEMIDGGDSDLLGRFVAFLQAAFSVRDTLKRARAIDEWSISLAALMDSWFSPQPDSDEDSILIRKTLERMATSARRAGFTDRLSLDALRALLRTELESGSKHSPSNAHGVTFAQLGSLRNLPFRVIAVLGLSEDRYPRRGRELEFDLMAKERRRGDRIAREEDLNLFLDALLAADEVFYLSYVGQDQRGRGELPPSVLLSDLIEYLDAGFVAHDGRRPSSALSFRHPLQPFSRRYFSGQADFFSYTQPLCDALRSAAGGAAKPAAFLSRPLPMPDADDCQVTLDQLTAFLRHPTRYFLRNRLGVLLTEAEGELPVDEPFRLGRYEQEALQARLVAAMGSHRSDAEERAMMRAAGLLSAGSIGDAEFDRSRAAATGFVRRMETIMPGVPLPPQWIEVAGAGFQLTGWLVGLSDHGLFGYRAAAVMGRDLLDFWIRHLVLHLAAPANIPRESRWVFADASYRIGPLPDAHDHLSDLLALYREGLTRPLKFFSRSAWAYARAIEKGNAQPMVAARRVWEGSDAPRFGAGERSEVYHDLCFGRIDPLDTEFADIALRVYRPLLRALTDPS